MTWKKGNKSGAAAKDWTADKLTEEINNMDAADYETVMGYLLLLPIDKVKYIAKDATRIPLIYRLLASALLNDMKQCTARTLDQILPYIAKKKPQQSEVLNVSTQPNLTIQVSSELVQNKLQTLIGNNADDKDV